MKLVKLFHCATKDKEDIINISEPTFQTVVKYIFRGINKVHLKLAHEQVCVVWGKWRTHCCALHLVVEVIFKFELVHRQHTVCQVP